MGDNDQLSLTSVTDRYMNKRDVELLKTSISKTHLLLFHSTLLPLTKGRISSVSSFLFDPPRTTCLLHRNNKSYVST